MARAVRLKVAAWILGGILGIVVLLVALLHTPPVRRFALNKGVEILGKQGIRFNAAEFNYNLLELEAGLGQVEVRSPQAPDLPPLLTADRIQVDLSLRKILQGSYDIQDATIRNPVVHLVIDKDGRDNIPRPPGSESSGGNTDFLIEKALIEGGTLWVEDRRRQLDGRLPLERITINGDDLTDKHTIELRTRDTGQISFGGRTLQLKGVGANVVLDKKSATVSRLSVGLGESMLNLSGRVDDFDNPRIDLRADSTLALQPLINFADVKQTASGTLQLGLTAKGTIDALKADAHIEGDDLTIDKLRNVDLKSDLTYDAAASRVRFHSLNVNSPSGTVRGTADIALNQQAGTSTANVAASGLDLQRLSTTFKTPVKVASRADAKIAARWPGLEVERATGDATVQLTANRRAGGKDVIPVQGRINAQTNGNRVVVTIPGLQTLNASASGNIVLVNQSTLDGQVKVVSDDLAATMRAADAFLGRQPTSTPVSGRATIVADLGGTIKKPVVDATVDAPEVNVGTLQGVKVQGGARIVGSDVVLKDSTINWQGQTLTASGTIGKDLDLTATTQNVKVESLLAGLNRTDIPASGNLQVDARITGSSKAPAVDVNLTGSDLVAYSEQVGNLKAQAQLRGDLLTIQQLDIDKPQEGGDGTLRASGTVDLETKGFNLEAKSENLRLTQLTLPNGMPVRGTLALNAAVQGTVEEPAGTVELAANELLVGQNKLGELKVNSKVASGVADIDVAAPTFNLVADAQIGIKAPYPATVEVRADNTDLAALPVENMPVKGTVTAVVRAKGDIENWESGQASAEIAALDLNYNGQPLRSEGPLVASYQAQKLTIDQATLLARDSRLQLQGTLPLDPAAGEGEIRLSTQLDLPSLLQYLPAEQQQGITARGTATIDGTIRGTLKRIDPDIAITLSDGYFFTPQLNPPVSGANLKGQIRGGVLDLSSLTASLGPAELRASGTVPFVLLPADLPVELPRGQGPAKLTAELANVDLGTIAALPDEVGGAVAARLEVEATKPDISALSGTLTLPTLQLNYGTIKLQQEGTSTVVFASGLATVQQFKLTGPDTNIALSGTAAYTGDQALNITLAGTTNVGLLSAVAEDVNAEGKTELSLAVSGTATQPQANGYVQLANGSLSLREPRIGVEDLNLRIDLAGTKATISQLSGELNGGKMGGGGTVDFTGGQLQSANLNLKADDIYLDVPEGLKTVSKIDIRVADGRNNTIDIGGQIDIDEGGFTDDLNFDRGILALADTSRGIDLTTDRNPLLERMRFNIGVRTLNPIVVDNNLADAEITADIRVLGTPYELGMSGRLEIYEGSELTLQERRYSVERGVITFTSDRRIEPNMEILATTTAAGYNVRLQISGYPGMTETTLTSDPPLPEPDILALLITGRTVEDLRGQEFEVARNQVLSYLTGRVGSTIGRQIEGATGLSTVRIEPNLIAAETDPSARLTVGQDITRNLELIYSMDLRNSSDQIYVAEYDITRRFTTRAVRQDDGSLRMDFRHDLRMGGTPEPRRGEQRIDRLVGNVSIIGEQYFTEAQIQDKFKVKEGKRYDFFKARKGLDRVNKMYAKANLLESRVRMRRQDEGKNVDISLDITAGPVVDFVYEGISVPGKVQKRIREIWKGGVFQSQRAEESVEALRAWLVDENRLRPVIEYQVTEPEPGRKRVLFDIQPGPEFHDVQLAFEGSKAIEEDDLREVVAKQKLKEEVYTAPGRVTELLTAYYHEMGYLDAEVSEPRYELDSAKGTGTVVFPVVEGPLFYVGNVKFEGNTVYTNAELLTEVPLPTGEPYHPRLRQNAIDRLRQAYWDLGFNDVDTEFRMVRTTEKKTVDITFRITEGRQSVVRDVRVEGRDNTSENLVRTQVDTRVGDIVDFTRLGESRRNLYGTGAFALVEIAREDMEPEENAATSAAADGEFPGERPVRLVVRVREVQPWQVVYGAFFDTERGPGGIVDVSNRNMLGSARVMGMRVRYDSQLREGRLYFSQPSLLRFPLRTIASPYVSYERNPATEDADPFNVDRVGFSVQQEAIFKRSYVLNYGYKIERTRTYDPTDNLFDIRLRIAGFTTTLSRENRDEILDATRGSFFSHAIQYSPSFAGSEVQFIKYFGQYFKYFPLQKPRIELFTNKVMRPRLVYATGVRVGLGKGLAGQEIPLSERFLAGGSNTVRGFEQNSLGLEPGFEVQTGGDAMFVLNNEIRAPLFRMFDGVAFVDLGNVYRRVSDFSLTDLRKTAGLGIRMRTPWFVLRFDYGMKLDRREGESRGRWYFGIGQAF